MRAVLAVAVLGISLFSAGLSGLGRVDQQVAQADVVAAQQAAKAKSQARAVDCPWRERHEDRDQL
jgi:hypothetical protein